MGIQHRRDAVASQPADVTSCLAFFVYAKNVGNSSAGFWEKDQPGEMRAAAFQVILNPLLGYGLLPVPGGAFRRGKGEWLHAAIGQC